MLVLSKHTAVFTKELGADLRQSCILSLMLHLSFTKLGPFLLLLRNQLRQNYRDWRMKASFLLFNFLLGPLR